MAKLHSSNNIIRMLQRHGFVFVSQKGSHMKFRKTEEQTLTVIVPAGRKEMPMGTFRSILRQSGLKEKDFSNV
jgi:predicted RNA binding protein YcfA (HicA-like mRNA interferase family)